MDSEPGLRPFLPCAAQPACYNDWLKVEIALRFLLTWAWRTEAWPILRQEVPWLLTERRRFGRQGTFN